MGPEALMRFRGLLRKEWLQILRDPSSIAIAFVMPVVLLFIFGYGVTLDAKHIPSALVVEKPNGETASLTAAFFSSPYFAPVRMRDIQQAERALSRREVASILWMRSNFSRRMLSSAEAPIALTVNGVDANNARIVQGYVQQVWDEWLGTLARSEGRPLAVPVSLEARVWFNPTVRSRDYLVPGLIAIIMTLIGALLTAMVVAREWERGTMEALMVTPISMREILVSKLIPYFVLGMGGMGLSVALAVWLFEVPLRGSFWLLWLGSSLFLLVALGMGLLISSVAKNQFVAGQIAIIVTFLPAFILSGFIFEIRGMPTAIQWITHLVPARYYVSILQTLFLAGDIWPVLWPNLLALVLMAAFFLGRTRQISRKRLE